MIIVNGWKLLTIITEFHLGCCSSPRTASDYIYEFAISAYHKELYSRSSGNKYERTMDPDSSSETNKAIKQEIPNMSVL